MKPTKYELTDRELKLIINYIRSEARLSYQLRNMLWLTQENKKLLQSAVCLSQNFKHEKSILRSNVNKEIYKYIIEGDEVNPNVPQGQKARLKDDEIKDNQETTKTK